MHPVINELRRHFFESATYSRERTDGLLRRSQILLTVIIFLPTTLNALLDSATSQAILDRNITAWGATVGIILVNHLLFEMAGKWMKAYICEMIDFLLCVHLFLIPPFLFMMTATNGLRDMSTLSLETFAFLFMACATILPILTLLTFLVFFVGFGIPKLFARVKA